MKEKKPASRRLQESLLAIQAHLLKNTSLSGENRAEVEAAVNALLQAGESRNVEREAMRRLESKMILMHGESVSNVIPFRRLGLARPPEMGALPQKRWTLRFDCLIEARYISEIHKMAIELHSQSRRYAFIEFRDLENKTRTHLPDLLSMGAITLFVPNFLDLLAREQEALLELTRIDSMQRPLLMVGSTLPYADLRTEAGVNLDLLATLARAYIKLSKPVHEYRDQIHYFLDSLSENPT